MTRNVDQDILNPKSSVCPTSLQQTNLKKDILTIPNPLLETQRKLVSRKKNPRKSQIHTLEKPTFPEMVVSSTF